MEPRSPVTFLMGRSRKYSIHQIFIPNITPGFKTLDGIAVIRRVEQIQAFGSAVGIDLVLARIWKILRQFRRHVFVTDDPVR